MPNPTSRRQGRDTRSALRVSTGLFLVLMALSVVLAACDPSRQAKANVNPRANNQRVLTYVAIGASDAFGIGTDDPDRDNWPTVLANLLGRDVHLVNLGIPGETTAEARQAELPVALDAKPALVTVWLGVNDIVQSVSIAQFEDQLGALLTALHERTHARVFVGNIPDISLLPFFASYDQATLRATIAVWNAAISQQVIASGSSLIDLNATWNELASHPEYIASDGFHPSTMGARRLAEVFESWIAPSLAGIRATAGKP